LLAVGFAIVVGFGGLVGLLANAGDATEIDAAATTVRTVVENRMRYLQSRGGIRKTGATPTVSQPVR